MRGNILGFVENNIAMRLLLASRLSALGYHVTVVSSRRAFRRQLESQPFDWLILHDAALAGEPDLLARVARLGTRIVWLGRPPRQQELPIAATFGTPLVYAEIAEYFSQQGPDESQHGSGAGMRDGEVGREEASEAHEVQERGSGCCGRQAAHDTTR